MIATSLKGNGSILFFSAGTGIFYLWDWLSRLPDSAPLAISVGLFDLEIPSKRIVDRVASIAVGWLGISTLISLENLSRLPRHLLRPLRLIRSEELQGFFSATPTFLCSLLFLIGMCDLALVNWSIPLTSSYEILLQVPPGQGAYLVNEQEPRAAELRVSREAQAWLIGLKPGGEIALVVRDKYNLVTLEVLCISRHVLTRDVSTCLAQAGDRRTSDLAGARAVGLVGIEIYGELQGRAQRVEVPMTIGSGVTQETMNGGWIEPGEAKDGPESQEQEYAQKFLSQLYSGRFEFADWDHRTTTELGSDRAVLVGLGDYQIRVVFEEKRVGRSSDQWYFLTREARRLVVMKP